MLWAGLLLQRACAPHSCISLIKLPAFQRELIPQSRRGWRMSWAAKWEKNIGSRRFARLLARTWCVQNALKKTQAGEEGGVSNGAKGIYLGRVKTRFEVHARWFKVLRWTQRLTLTQLHSKNMRTDREVKTTACSEHLQSLFYFFFFL